MPIYDWGGDLVHSGWTDLGYVGTGGYLAAGAWTRTDEKVYSAFRWNTTGTIRGWHVLTHNGQPLTYGGGGAGTTTTVSWGGRGGGAKDTFRDSAERRRMARIEQEERAGVRAQASARSTELLLSLLPPEEVQRFHRDGVFHVRGSHGNRYRIHPYVSGNIQLLDDKDQVVGVLCAHPTMDQGWLPTPDVMLAQMLALTSDEREFARVANLHRGRMPTFSPERRLAIA